MELASIQQHEDNRKITQNLEIKQPSSQLSMNQISSLKGSF